MQKISEVANHIRQAKGVCFIIGAGASISANIPSAKDLVELVKADYGHCLHTLSKEEKNNYGKVMRCLAPAERGKIILPLLAKSRVNWGYIALATLAREKHIKRVLTFNFDLVLERAVSLLGFQMPVYDFAVAQTTDINRIAGSSILHLHGQSHGLVLLNSEPETEAHKNRLRPLLADTVRNHMTIVIGYSGETDGAFDVIQEEFNEQHRLIWFGHSDQPPPHLKPLLDREYAEYVGGSDFDLTMIEIARELGIWPPAIFENPMRHLLNELGDVIDFPLQQENEHNVLTITREKLETHAQNWETGKNLDERANALLLTGNDEFGEAEKLLIQVENMSDNGRHALYWVYNNEGTNNAKAAELLSGKQATSKYLEAHQNYWQAIKINPNGYEAVGNWGTALLNEAITQTGKEKSERLIEAITKFKQVLENQPNDFSALINWGSALLDEAKQLGGEDRSRKFAEAQEKFIHAKRISGTSIYNLACIFALIGEHPSALKELHACHVDSTLPDFAHLNSDTDIDSLRENNEFIALLESIRQ